MASAESKLIQRIRSARRYDGQRLEPHRLRYKKMLAAYAGPNWTGTSKRAPLPLMFLWTNTFIRSLASKRPGVLAVPRKIGAAPEGVHLEIELNLRMERMDLGSTLRRWAFDALYGIGWIKAGTTPSGRWYDDDQMEAMLFAKPVGLDNIVWDTRPRDIYDAAYIMDRYELPMEYAEDHGGYDKRMVRKLTAESETSPDRDGEVRMKEYGWSKGRIGESFCKRALVWDVYLADRKEIWTIPDVPIDDDGGETAMRIRECDEYGALGPYHPLCFYDVPDNGFPVAPAAQWFDFHKSLNNLFVKCYNQAITKKRVLWSRAGSEDDANRFKNAEDGGSIVIQDETGVGTLANEGVDPTTNAFMFQVRDLASWFGGSIETLAGLGAQSGTARQDELIHSSASALVQDMQSTATKAARELIRCLAGYVLNDPDFHGEGVRRVGPAELGVEVPYAIGHGEMEYEWDAADFNIEPYSMVDMSPSQTLQALMTLLGVAGQLLPFAQQQGIGPDAIQILKDTAKALNVSVQADGWLKMVDLGGETDQAETPQPGNPNKPNGRYTREGRPGMTRAGADRAMMTAAAANNEGSGGRRSAAAGRAAGRAY